MRIQEKIRVIATITILFYGIQLTSIYAQHSNRAVNYNIDYLPNIESVLFHPVISPVDFPVLFLGKSDPIFVRFDDLDGDFVYYRYKIVHCDANWQPSNISDLEYIDGLNDQEVRNFAYSLNTRQNYTQYSFFFPNDNLNITKSGNYLLHVYRDSDGMMVFTRRFVVSEESFKMEADQVQALGNANQSEDQRINVNVAVNDFNIPDPNNQIKLVIIQNQNWSISEAMPPRNQILNDFLFNYPDKPVFKGLKEFRALDLRSFRRPPFMIENLERYSDRTEVFLRTDVLRGNKSNVFYPDLNGAFIVDNLDSNLDSLSIDYAQVHFYLQSQKLDNPVYVTGAFNNWGLNPDCNPMTYNADKGYYEGSLLLKQGYYDYYYGEKTSQGFDYTKTEGSSFETRNSYQVMLYYRPYGERYDRLVKYSNIGIPVVGQLSDGRN